MRNTDKKKENKVLMSMRISVEDKELIEKKARKTGLTTSEYMRRCALGRKLPCYGGQQSDTNLRILVDKTLSHGISVKIVDRHHRPVLKGSHYGVNLVFIDPQASGLDGSPLSLF